MEFHWMKPLQKPPGPMTIDGLSSSARKVLAALIKTFRDSFEAPLRPQPERYREFQEAQKTWTGPLQRTILDWGNNNPPSSSKVIPDSFIQQQVPSSLLPDNNPQLETISCRFADSLCKQNEVSVDIFSDGEANDEEESVAQDDLAVLLSNFTPENSPLRCYHHSAERLLVEDSFTEPLPNAAARKCFDKKLKSSMNSPVSFYGNASVLPLTGEKLILDPEKSPYFGNQNNIECKGQQRSNTFKQDSPVYLKQTGKINRSAEWECIPNENKTNFSEDFLETSLLTEYQPAKLKDDGSDCSYLFSDSSSETQLENRRRILKKASQKNADNEENNLGSVTSSRETGRVSTPTIEESISRPLLFLTDSLEKGHFSAEYFDFSDDNAKELNENSEDDLQFPSAIQKCLVPSDEKSKGSKTKRKYLGTPFKRAFASVSGPHSEQIKKKLNFDSDQHSEINLNQYASSEQNNFLQSPKLETALEGNKNLKTNSKQNSERAKRQTVLYFDAHEQTSVTDGEAKNEGTGKRKLKFKVPYKSQVQMNAEHNESITTGKSVARQLFHDSTEELEAQIHKAAPPIEVAVTIIYKGGFTQLNKPKHSDVCHPTGVLLRIVWESEIQFVSLSVSTSSKNSTILKALLLNKNRKICFGAQEMCQLLIDKFNFSTSEVCLELLLLDPLVGSWLLSADHPPETFDDVIMFLKMDQVPIANSEQLLTRLSKSAECLYQRLSVHALWKLFLHVETRITPILASMEIHGINVDVQKLQDMNKQLEMEMLLLQEKAHKSAGKVFQLTSPQQLGVILYDELKLDIKNNIRVKETTKRQHKSTSETTLLQFKNVHPLPGIIIEFRKIHKLKTTYVDSVLEHASDNGICTTWQQTSVATGRIVSMDPNLQAVPKNPLQVSSISGSGNELSLRSAYIARLGCSFVGADFQQIELRIFAHLSKDSALIQALHQPQDIFVVLAQRWLGSNSIEDVSNEDRDKTKRIVYALMYGAGPSKLMEFLQISYQQASAILKSFIDTFPSMEEFTKKTSEKCKTQGFLATESGRRRWFPNITNANVHLRQHAERQAINFLIQGTAADICKCAMIQAQRRLGMNMQGARLLLQIHDELLWEVLDSDIKKVSEIVQSAMEDATTILPSLSKFSVPLPVLVKTGKNWAEMKVIKETSFGIGSQAQPP